MQFSIIILAGLVASVANAQGTDASNATTTTGAFTNATTSTSDLTTTSFPFANTTAGLSTTSTATTSAAAVTTSAVVPGGANIAGFEYLGCFADSSGFPGYTLKYNGPTNSASYCTNTCSTAGFTFSGLLGSKCYCSGSPPSGSSTTKVPDSDCSSKCPGDPSQSCGGSLDGQVPSRKRQVNPNFLLSLYRGINSNNASTTLSTSSTPSAVATVTLSPVTTIVGGTTNNFNNGTTNNIGGTTNNIGGITNNIGGSKFVTQIVNAFVTFCPSPTVFTVGIQTFTAVAPSWVTVSSCPGMCTISNLAGATPTVVPSPCNVCCTDCSSGTCKGCSSGACSGCSSPGSAPGGSSGGSSSGSSSSGSSSSSSSSSSGGGASSGGSPANGGSSPANGGSSPAGVGSSQPAGSNRPLLSSDAAQLGVSAASFLAFVVAALVL